MCNRPSIAPKSIKAPYSVIFLTVPLITAPSCSDSSNFSRSSPIVTSRTARRDNTTLLRLRSNLITLNSKVLPSKALVSLTGRKSTKEPGKKARMPLVITVKPPLTLPVMVPLTNSPDSSACSSCNQADKRLARSRERIVEP